LNGSLALVGGGQEDLERRAVAGVALNRDEAAVVLDEGMDVARPMPLPGRLGREERLENAPADLLRDSHSGIGRLHEDVSARTQLSLAYSCTALGIDRDVCGGQRQGAPLGMASRALTTRLSTI